jgi:hypothetical protein
MSYQQTAMEKVTTVAAGAATLSPWWLENLSGFSAKVLPVLGVAWLLLQSAKLIWSWYREYLKKN